MMFSGMDESFTFTFEGGGGTRKERKPLKSFQLASLRLSISCYDLEFGPTL